MSLVYEKLFDIIKNTKLPAMIGEIRLSETFTKVLVDSLLNSNELEINIIDANSIKPEMLENKDSVCCTERSCISSVDASLRYCPNCGADIRFYKVIKNGREANE
jgi:hypothetical protein